MVGAAEDTTTATEERGYQRKWGDSEKGPVTGRRVAKRRAGLVDKGARGRYLGCCKSAVVGTAEDTTTTAKEGGYQRKWGDPVKPAESGTAARGDDCHTAEAGRQGKDNRSGAEETDETG